MKKIVLTLAVLMLASPAWATVVITAAPGVDTNEVVISFDATTETVLPRAFSLNIQLDDPNSSIASVGDVNPDFPIHPGTISIDLSGPEPSIDYGTPVAPQADLPSDTLPGLGTTGITIEMGSLYAPTGPGSPNAPDPCGPLLTLVLAGDPGSTICLTITGNVARAGSKGVVLEDPDLDPTVTVPPANTFCIILPTVGPACWSFVGQPCGDSDGSGGVNFADLVALKASWLKSDPDPAYNPCADFTQDGGVNFADLVKLKAYWLKAVPPCP